MNKFTNLTEALKWRYGTSNFDMNQKLTDEEVREILEAGNLAPTSFGLQPFQFVVISDQAKKEPLVAHSWNQEHVAKNSHLIAIAVRTDINEAYIDAYLDNMATTRGLTREMLAGFREMMVGSLMSKDAATRAAWAKNQAYIALGTIIDKASEMGIDNHALEGFSQDKYNEMLGLTEKNLHAVVLLAIGRRSADDQAQHYPKVRKNLDEMIVSI